MAEMTLADLSGPAAALTLLVAGRRDLPPADFQIGPIFPEQLRIAVHDQPGAFDAWLAAIAPERVQVAETTQSEGRTRVRRAQFRYAGCDVDLSEFTDAAGGGRRE